jgi:isopentenyldiphosphate isomerase
MSMLRELTFFLGIQVKQTKEDIFIHKAKYMKDLMKKFNMTELESVSILMSTTTALNPDENGEAIDQKGYRSMIGSLMYLMATRLDIQFTVCLCAHF